VAHHPLSVQLWSVRDRIADDRDGVLRRIAQIGYGAVEPYNPLDDPKGFRQVADDLGLAISSVHAGALVRQEPGPVFEAVATLGTGLVIVPAGIPEDEFTTRDGAQVSDVLRRLGDKVLALHVKDGPVAKDQPHTAVGKGVMPVPEILAASPDAWRIVELDSCATDIFDALTDSYSYLTGLEPR